MKRTQARRRPAAHREPADEQAATELVMYIENTSDLSPDGPRGQGRSVLLNALRKWRKGTYDPAKAVTLFEYLTEAGAKRYAKEFDSEKNWSSMFNPATRHEAAKQLEASFRNAAQNGEYDHVDTRIGVSQSDRTVVNARRATRIDKLRSELPSGYSIETYSPGDGVTRYRFFKNAPKNQTYFGPDNGIYTALGYKEAEAFASGLMSESRAPNEARRRKKPPERPAAREQRLDSFTRAYFETALWSSTDESNEQGGDPLDDNYGIDDIAPETRAKMIADCADFQERYDNLMLDGTSERGGHDFWLTRNRHGAGFWDGDWEHGDELTKAAHAYGGFYLYVGDDGLIYGQ